MSQRAEFFLAGRVVEPIPVVTATEDKIAMRLDDNIVLVFAAAETQHQKVVGRHQETFLMRPRVIDMERAGSGPCRRQEIEAPPVGTELFVTEKAELVFGVALAAVDEGL